MIIDCSKELPSREDLRERIILAALDAFSVHGIKSVRMDDIANSLRISKRTLYEIFADKETLLEECILYHQKISQKMLEEIVSSSRNVLEVILKCYKVSIEMYHKTNRCFFEDIKKYPRVYDLIMRSRERDDTVVINFLKRGVEQGLFRSDVNLGIIHMLLSEQMDLMMESAVCKKYSFLEVYEALIFTYLRGVVTEKGAGELNDFVEEYREEKRHNLRDKDIQEK